MLDIVVEMAMTCSSDEEAGRVPRERKLDFISDCIDSGIEIRVRTPFEPTSYETLLDLGSDLARIGVTNWLIAPMVSPCWSSLRDTDFYSLVAEEIQHVFTAFPWISVDNEVIVESTSCGLVGPDGKPIPKGSQRHRAIVADVKCVNEALVKKLAADPKLFYSISPREFEEVVAHVLEKLGYAVKLTPATRDGGKDLFVAQNDALGNFLYLVECKRYAPERPVGVEVVRSLYGVMQAEKATAGILATTSFFSKEAREFQSSLRFQMQLHDYYHLQAWLRKVLGPS